MSNNMLTNTFTIVLISFLFFALVGTIEQDGNAEAIISLLFYIAVAIAILNRKHIINYLKNPEQ